MGNQKCLRQNLITLQNNKIPRPFGSGAFIWLGDILYIYIYMYIPTYPHAHMQATSWSKHWRLICPNPLKRYPPDLCPAISRMVGCAAPGSATTPSSVQDGVYLVAEALQCGYDPVTDGTHGVDAADFWIGISHVIHNLLQ